MSEQDAYQLGLRDGYAAGEAERIALATANDRLHHELLQLHQWIDVQCSVTSTPT